MAESGLPESTIVGFKSMGAITRSTDPASWADAKVEMERMRLAAGEGATLVRVTKQFRDALKELPEEQRTEAKSEREEMSWMRKTATVLR